jgi:hypothetical protein
MSLDKQDDFPTSQLVHKYNDVPVDIALLKEISSILHVINASQQVMLTLVSDIYRSLGEDSGGKLSDIRDNTY